MTQVSPLPPVPEALRRRHRVLEVSGWSAVTSIGVAAGTVSAGGEESDDLRLRVGSRVLLSPVVADTDARRSAALALTAPTADRGVTAPTVLWSGTAVLAGLDGRGAELGIAAILAGAFVGLGAWHAWRTRWPDDALLERMGADAILYAHLLLLGLTAAARKARAESEDADDLWRTWIESARGSAYRTDGLSADDVDAELDRLPRWDR